MPTTVGVYVTWHVAVPAVVPAARVQLVDGVNVPEPSVVKLTLPVGVAAPVEDVSVTVAVQVVEVLTVTAAGAHVTLVEVGCAAGGVTVTAKVP